MNRQNRHLCIVFPMGIEAYPFLRRVEVLSRRRVGKAVYREAFFEGHRLTVVRCGIGPERAASAVRGLECRPQWVISAGIAGALVAGIRTGDMVIASETVFGHEPHKAIACQERLVSVAARACTSEGIPHRIGRLATVKAAVFGDEERRRLHELTAAQAVDMESHAIGMEAGRLGSSFVALRVISDDMESPPPATVRSVKQIWKDPARFRQNLSAILQWWKFVRTVRSVVELLHPVLVRVTRDIYMSTDSVTRGERLL
jgi:adenosylhomocysteine nucleosidase